MSNKPINVLIYCEFNMISIGLSSFLGEFGQFKVVNGNSQSCIHDLISKSSMDVLVIDLGLLKQSGLSLIKEIHKTYPAIRIVILSRKEKEPFISKCMTFGALGYISLNCDQEELIKAIESAYKGDRYLSQEVAYDFALSRLNKDSNCVLQLTDREYQVFTMIAQGLSVKSIADRMCLSPKTVHVYRSNIMKKLSVTNVSELTIVALKNGIITIDLVN